jgi:prophage regulatory protein
LRLMGAAEIQARLGVSRQRAYVLVNRRDFPEPYVTLAMGNVWLGDDVEKWIKKHRPDLSGEDEV